MMLQTPRKPPLKLLILPRQLASHMVLLRMEAAPAFAPSFMGGSLEI